MCLSEEIPTTAVLFQQATNKSTDANRYDQRRKNHLKKSTPNKKVHLGTGNPVRAAGDKTFLSGTTFCTWDFAPPEPEFGAEFWETNFGRLNFGPEFLRQIFSFCFSSKRDPSENSPSRKSPSKIQPRNWATKIHIAPLQGRLAEFLPNYSWDPVRAASACPRKRCSYWKRALT